jgi:hypothetical protein
MLSLGSRPVPAHAMLPSLPLFRPPSLDAVAVCLSYHPDIGISPEQWRAFVESRANALIIGRPDLVVRLWTSVWPALTKPVFWTRSGSLRLPPQPVPTLVLECADELGISEQLRLLEGLDGEAGRTRVLATTKRLIEPQVAQGTFLEPLYQRLNPMVLTLSAA